MIAMFRSHIPSGNLTVRSGKSPMLLLMGKSTISMVIFNSKLLNYRRVPILRMVLVRTRLLWMVGRSPVDVWFTHPVFIYI